MEAIGPRSCRRIRMRNCILCCLLATINEVALAQGGNHLSLSLAPPAGSQASSNAPLTITLEDALKRAKRNNPSFQAALTELGLAREDRVQSRSAMLPNATYNMEGLYTEGNGTRSNVPVFIANNAVHEYVAQVDVHQELGPRAVLEYRQTGARLALAKAKAEIAERGLVVTVVQAYYGHVVAQRKYATAQRAASEAERFVSVSQKLEQGGEVAHSDVVKAQIQDQQRQRDLQEAELEMTKSRLELAVLLFPDFNENFAVVDDLRLPEPLPSFQEVTAAGTRNNPQLAAAMAALKEANAGVAIAWATLLPSVGVDYFYGLDASHLAVHQFDPLLNRNVNNLGSSAMATLTLPVWTWGAGISRITQADLKRHQARMELSFAQRQLLANLRSFYNEAQTARAELELLNRSAEFSAESLRLTTLRYQAGEASVLEVVDAQNTLTQAENAYDDGQARFRLAVATLETLTGRF